MKPAQSFIDPDFGTCDILFQKDSALHNNVCLFASHTPLPFLPEYIYFYLSDIKKAGFSIIFISSSTIASKDVERLAEISDIVIAKENRGTDFGAWCAVLRWLDLGRNFESLYLCNDSVFGPLIPFEDIHAKFVSRIEDIIGITDSHQGIGYHIQSYFVGIKNNVLQSEAWLSFWKEMAYLEDKTKVIEFYEIGLTQNLMKAGFHWFVLADWSRKIDNKDLVLKISQSEILRERWLNRFLEEREKLVFNINPSSFLWKELITEYNNPFLKRELFVFEHLFEECEVSINWENTLLEKSAYPIFLIKNFLIHFFFYKYWKGRESTEWLEIEVMDNKHAKPSKCPLFEALSSLLILTRKDHFDIPTEISALLTEAGIIYLPLNLYKKNTDESFLCLIIYINLEILNLSYDQLNKTKELLREHHELVLVTPNVSVASVAARLLGIKLEKIIIESDLYTPQFAPQLIDKLVLVYTHSMSVERRSLYQRPMLFQILKDALQGENITGFLNRENPEQQVFETFGEEVKTESDSDYAAFLQVVEKYTQLYERTPSWYKKGGQLLKLMKGNKRLVFGLKDKHSKETYKQTAEDVAHWYYLQYEILPRWYKRIGMRLLNGKDKSS